MVKHVIVSEPLHSLLLNVDVPHLELIDHLMFDMKPESFNHIPQSSNKLKKHIKISDRAHCILKQVKFIKNLKANDVLESVILNMDNNQLNSAIYTLKMKMNFKIA